MLAQQGRITEDSAANIFFLQKDKVITPALNQNIFPGITRATLLDIAYSWEIEVIERDVRPEELGNFDGAFLAATMMELKPLKSIDSHHYESANHLLFWQFLTEFQEITHQ